MGQNENMRHLIVASHNGLIVVDQGQPGHVDSIEGEGGGGTVREAGSLGMDTIGRVVIGSWVGIEMGIGV